MYIFNTADANWAFQGREGTSSGGRDGPEEKRVYNQKNLPFPFMTKNCFHRQSPRVDSLDMAVIHKASLWAGLLNLPLHLVGKTAFYPELYYT